MAGSTDSASSIRVPYRNLRDDQEVEMVSVDDAHHRIELNSPPASSSSPPSARAPNGTGGDFGPAHCSLVTLVLSCTVAAGVQFGWALQLSLLTPYIQVTWLCWHCLCGFILVRFGLCFLMCV